MSDSLPFLPFALPDIGEEEIAEVVDTLRSGWITTGPKAKRFEEDFTTYLGDASLQSLAVNSATAACTSHSKRLASGRATKSSRPLIPSRQQPRSCGISVRT